MRILLAVKEAEEGQRLKERLEESGLVTDVCTDGEEACARLMLGSYSAAVLALELPGQEGRAILSQLAEHGKSLPVIFLSERPSTEEKVACLNQGACEYLAKSCDPRELAACIQAAVRTAGGYLSDVFQADTLTMDTRTGLVRRDGRIIDLTRTEYALLEYLLRNQGRLLSKESIRMYVWGPDYDGVSNVVEVYINYLRQKIDRGCPVELVKTVRGRGYMLSGDRQACS